jgi:MFS transporter, putative metabolite:H+ symporter
LVFSALAEKVGRIRGTTAAIAIMSIMSFGCAMAWNFPTLLVCRLVQGIGVGGEMPVAATYINELSRAHGRGRFFLLYEMIFPVGLMATGQIGTWLVPAFGWSSIFLLGGIPGLLITLLVARLPESPRWLISKGRIREAEAIVERMEASTDRRVPAATASVTDSTSSPMQRGRWGELLSNIYRRRTLIVWILWASAFFIANSLNNWMPSLYNTVYHLSLRQSLRAASMTNVAQVVVLLVCALSIDRIGRRNWTVAAFVLGGGMLAFLGMTGAQKVLSVIILGTLGYGIIGSINAVLYLYTPEIYPTRMRAIGTGLATSWLRIASAVGPALLGFMVDAKGIRSVFLLFAVVSVVGAFAATCMVETSDRRLEEIAP